MSYVDDNDNDDNCGCGTGGLQSKSIFWMPTLQSPFAASYFGSLNVTALAPPHCSFLMLEPPALQGAVVWHFDPSGMS